MKACDADLDIIDWSKPKIIQPKIDGVRGLYLESFSSRTLKPFGNTFVNNRFSSIRYRGLDGELTHGVKNHPDLCRLTTSALNQYEGQPNINWYVFDLIHKGTIDLPYKDRLILLNHRLNIINDNNIHLMETEWCNSLEEFLLFENIWLEYGYEGVIIRDPYGLYKSGRSTIREGGLLRVKRFKEEEAIILDFIPAETNNNIIQTNKLGLSYRTSHKENKVIKEMVGSFIAKDIKTKEIIKIGAGKLSHKERIDIYINFDNYKNRICKYKQFMHGKLHKPRFPIFICFRDNMI